jgi:hypothetical protein
MDNKFYILRIEHNSVWEVINVDTNHNVVKEGWITAICLDEGEEHKTFKGQQLQIPAMTVFGNPAKYDVSKNPFHLTPQNDK